MDFSLDRIRLTNQEKNYLTRMKGNTGIDNWNVLARWAFCYSISMKEKINIDSSTDKTSYGIEMSWMVFAGKNFKVYQDLLTQECKLLRIEPNKVNLNKVMRAHLSNGIRKLHGKVKSLDDFIKLAS